MPHGNKILVVGNDTGGMLRFRFDFLKALQSAGFQVRVAYPKAPGVMGDDDSATGAFQQAGFQTFAVNLDRAGMNPLADLAYRRELKQLMRTLRPQLVFAYGIKPILHALPAAQALGIQTAAMIAGLGSAFDKRQGIKQALIRLIATKGYQRALLGADHVFFQNPDDRAEFLALGIISDAQEASVTAGSGVNPDAFPRTALPPYEPGALTFLMVGRLIRQKGVIEYAQAVQDIAKDYPRARFLLAGGLDTNPNSITAEELQAYPALEWLGVVQDMQGLLASAHVFVLPSYYREGVPRSALEALATGRAVILADSPGTREAVIADKSGLLVTPQSSQALAAAMRRYLDEPALCQCHGDASFALVENRFSVHRVNAQLLTTLQAVLATPQTV